MTGKALIVLALGFASLSSFWHTNHSTHQLCLEHGVFEEVSASEATAQTRANDPAVKLVQHHSTCQPLLGFQALEAPLRTVIVQALRACDDVQELSFRKEDSTRLILLAPKNSPPLHG